MSPIKSSGSSPHAEKPKCPSLRQPYDRLLQISRQATPWKGGTSQNQQGSASFHAQGNKKLAEEAPLFFTYFHFHFLHDQEHVLPHFAFARLARVVQQVGRVIGHHEWNPFEFIPFPPTVAQSSHGVMTEESVGRRFAQSHHHLGRNDFDLGFEVREAKIHFPHRGRSVSIGLAVPRSPVHYVSEVHRFPRQTHGLDNLRQQLTGRADKRLSLLLFLGTGGFAAKEKVGVQVAGAKDNLAVGVEFGQAGRTGLDFFP